MHDAGEDAGARDAGERRDAGLLPDDGGTGDAGSFEDAGPHHDAGEPVDAATPDDAGSSRDAGRSDAGTRRDAGPELDGGQACTSTSMCPADGKEACINGECLPDPLWTQGTTPMDASPDSEFINNANGTVTDTITGLVWQQPMTSTVFDLNGAATYCANLSLGGYPGGWRLPSVLEALTLVVIGGNGPTINPDVFPNTLNQPIWTATPDNSSPGTGNYWLVDFSQGDNISSSPSSTGANVRCVLSFASGQVSPVGDASPLDTSAPPGRYTYAGGIISSSKTVEDNVSGLTWERNGSTNTVTLAAAKSHCVGLSIGTLTGGWRLPTTKELMTLIDFSTGGPAADVTAFPDMESDNYWSTSPQDGGTGSVDFSNGALNTLSNPSGTSCYVRCVH
jgi:hypothetical protein